MIVIVDYSVGNVGSIKNILKRVGGDCVISGDEEIISKADRLILPGVGSFDSGMRRLKAAGLNNVLTHRVIDDRVPTLGICLGMQLMLNGSEEGSESGLGWLPGHVKKFSKPDLLIPHMGWNSVSAEKDAGLKDAINNDSKFYFVHSYIVECENPDDVWMTTDHGEKFCSAFQRNNILGVQFHPEKSHVFGMNFIKSFIDWCP